jgi:hypothetical protein
VRVAAPSASPGATALAFRHFTALYPVFLADAESALAFLADIDTELQKLYPNAPFPVFECRRLPTPRQSPDW